MENRQIKRELVGERNRMNSDYHLLLKEQAAIAHMLKQYEKEMAHLDRLIAEQRPQEVGAL